MKKLPYMPFYGDDFINDTSMLTFEERWAYLHLLWLMWTNGGALLDDDSDNSRRLGMTLRKWRFLKERLIPFLIFYGPVTQRQFSQKRLQAELNKSLKNADKKSEAGKAGAEARWQPYQILKNGIGNASANASAIKNDGRDHGRDHGRRHGKTMPVHKESIITTLQDAAREERQVSERAEPSPDGACASDGAAPPALKSPVSHLLETPYLRRGTAKA